jgi:hypothetical protein
MQATKEATQLVPKAQQKVASGKSLSEVNARGHW